MGELMSRVPPGRNYLLTSFPVSVGTPIAKTLPHNFRNSSGVWPWSGGRARQGRFGGRVRGRGDRAGGADEGGDGGRARVLRPGQGQRGGREVADRPVGEAGVAGSSGPPRRARRTRRCPSRPG